MFAIDGLGALLSLLLLLGLLVSFEDFFGIPKVVLYRLLSLPLLFSLCSLGCYFVNPSRWQPYLRMIALANILYCLITFGLILYYQDQVTILGIAYFVGEKLVVLFLASIELRLANKS
jgi:hypothetical protein